MLLARPPRLASSKADRALASRRRIRKSSHLSLQADAANVPHSPSRHQHSAACACQRPGLGSILSLCQWLPTQKFGSSRLPAPLIVLLRFLLPAASLRLQCGNLPVQPNTASPVERAAAAGARFSSAYLRPRRLRRESSSDNIFAHLGYRVSATDFLREVTDDAKYDSWRIVSVTWVKALASHMSHEFIQFIAEDTATGERTRLIADRQETGDWVSITPNPNDPSEMSSTFTGLGSGLWSKSTPYRDRHTLPLPLVSISFGEPTLQGDSRPALRSIAELLVDITARCSEYNPLREHCWWFSEAVIEELRMQFPWAKLEEWQWHRYRYS